MLNIIVYLNYLCSANIFNPPQMVPRHTASWCVQRAAVHAMSPGTGGAQTEEGGGDVMCFPIPGTPGYFWGNLGLVRVTVAV